MAINTHGDRLVENDGRGSDIASQRIDDLDQQALDYLDARRSAGAAVQALDAGSGRCGMANRLAGRGVRVDAVDLQDYSGFADQGVQFHTRDLLEFLLETKTRYEVILCQRTIHYLPYEQAHRVIDAFVSRLQPGGRLYISASGMSSELSDGYAGREQPIQQRMARLSPAMQEKHGIREPVCLYALEELKAALTRAGLTILKAFESEFGNVKVVATKP